MIWIGSQSYHYSYPNWSDMTTCLAFLLDIFCLFLSFLLGTNQIEMIILYCRKPLQIFAGDYLLLKSTTKSHLTLLSVESKGRGNKAMIIPPDFTVSLSGQQQLLLSSQLPDTFSPCKSSSQAPSYASPSPKISPTHRLADGGEV